MPYIYMGVIVPLSIIIPISMSIIKYKDLSDELKIISWYLCLNGATNIITTLLAFYKINNMPAMHIYTAAEFVILSLFYKKILTKTNMSRYIDSLMLLFLLLCAVNVLFYQNFYTYNSYTKSLEAIIIIPLTISYFRKVLDNIDVLTISKNTILYVNSGLLLYFSGSFTLFIISNIIITNPVLSKLVWNTHATFLLAMYLFFAVALWKHKK